MTTTPAAPETAEAEYAADRLRRLKAEYAFFTRTRPVYEFPYSAVVVITGPDHAETFDAATDWIGGLDGTRDRDSLFPHRWLLDGNVDPTGVRRVLRLDPDLIGLRGVDAEVATVLLDAAATGHAVIVSSTDDVIDRDLAQTYGIRVRTLDDLGQIPPRLLLGPEPGVTVLDPGHLRLSFQPGDAQFYDEPGNRFISVTVADIALAADTDGVLDPNRSTMTVKGRVVNESNWEPGKRRAEMTDVPLAWLPYAAWRALIIAAKNQDVTITEGAYLTACGGGAA